MEQNAHKTTYMVGTEGGLDYIVVSTHAEILSIGVKPVVVQQNQLQVFIGFRVRMADNRLDQVNLADVEEFLEKQPTLFKWEKVDDVRASTMFGGLFPLPFGKSAEDLMESLEEQKYFQGLIDQLSGVMSLTEQVGTIMKFIQTPLQNQVVALTERFEKKEAPKNYAELYAKYCSPHN